MGRRPLDLHRPPNTATRLTRGHWADPLVQAVRTRAAHQAAYRAQREEIERVEREEIEREQRKQPAGRPKSSVDLEAATFVGAPTPLKRFISDLHNLNMEFNTSERLRAKFHTILQENVSSNFPSYYRAKSLILEQLHTPDKYPVCINDCYVHSKTIGQITPDDFKALKCTKCATPLADAKGRAKKVSPVPPPIPRFFH